LPPWPANMFDFLLYFIKIFFNFLIFTKLFPKFYQTNFQLF
jgi:hypothetical protein